MPGLQPPERHQTRYSRPTKQFKTFGGRGRIRTSVARKERQIYSLLPLAARPPVRALLSTRYYYSICTTFCGPAKLRQRYCHHRGDLLTSHSPGNRSGHFLNLEGRVGITSIDQQVSTGHWVALRSAGLKRF